MQRGNAKIEKSKRTWGIFWLSVNTLHLVTLGNSDDTDKNVNKRSLPELLLSNNLYIKYISRTKVKTQNEGRSYFNGKFAKI